MLLVILSERHAKARSYSSATERTATHMLVLEWLKNGYLLLMSICLHCCGILNWLCHIKKYYRRHEQKHNFSTFNNKNILKICQQFFRLTVVTKYTNCASKGNRLSVSVRLTVNHKVLLKNDNLPQWNVLRKKTRFLTRDTAVIDSDVCSKARWGSFIFFTHICAA